MCIRDRKNIDPKIKTNHKQNFDENAQKEFLTGAKIAYETIITDFSDDDNKLIKSKPLLSKKIQDQFNDALNERNKRGHFAEITFIGISFITSKGIVLVYKSCITNSIISCIRCRLCIISSNLCIISSFFYFINTFFSFKKNLPRNGSLEFFADAEVADMFNRYDAVVSRSKLFNVSKCTYETPLSQLPLKMKWYKQFVI